jgi:hypothetical protein
VDVRVDEPGSNDAVASIHHQRVVSGEVAPDICDPVAVDQDVAAVEVADVGVHRDDGRVLD